MYLFFLFSIFLSFSSSLISMEQHATKKRLNLGADQKEGLISNKSAKIEPAKKFKLAPESEPYSAKIKEQWNTQGTLCVTSFNKASGKKAIKLDQYLDILCSVFEDVDRQNAMADFQQFFFNKLTASNQEAILERLLACDCAHIIYDIMVTNAADTINENILHSGRTRIKFPLKSALQHKAYATIEYFLKKNPNYDQELYAHWITQGLNNNDSLIEQLFFAKYPDVLHNFKVAQAALNIAGKRGSFEIINKILSQASQV